MRRGPEPATGDRRPATADRRPATGDRRAEIATGRAAVEESAADDVDRDGKRPCAAAGVSDAAERQSS